MVVLIFPFLMGGCAEDENIETRIQTNNPKGLLAITVADGQDPQKPSYFWSNLSGGEDRTAQTLTIARKAAAGTAVWKLISDAPAFVVQSCLEP